MKIIYEPTGKAREYSPYAVNLYKGCGHKCKYCYVPNVIKVNRNDFDNNIEPKNKILQLLEDDLKKNKINKQILMSFSTDPYNPLDTKMQLTRHSLKLFLEYNTPIAILTKSGKQCLRDLDLFQKFNGNIKVGASLTLFDDKLSRSIEESAALPIERLETLRILKENNIKTWASLEPIIYTEQTLLLIENTIEFVDEYQLCKLSGDNRKIDWNTFMKDALKILRDNNKKIYIKQTLRESADKINFLSEETDMNRLTLIINNYSYNNNLFD